MCEFFFAILEVPSTRIVRCLHNSVFDRLEHAPKARREIIF